MTALKKIELHLHIEGAAPPALIRSLGAEKKLTERMSLTGEYEYANFGKEVLEDGLGASTRATPEFHNVKLGLNFKF